MKTRSTEPLVVAELAKNPDEKHWEAFRKYLLGSKAKYYKVFYPKKLKTKNDLLAAYVIIYDSKYLPMFRIPVIMKTKTGMQGATIYFKELLNTNKDYKEWIS
ncbi:MAG: hypothetical protein M1528_01635 [Candidatus Marsarchaeota archaeon]|jgi:preprotein translocase subunit SecE|nr:hypothetical protein [Candidatus Marsarchaeota archaeon]MCL5115215.1 hypothetical protein [Candidatus Marsarchaeota archaeon]